ncbi:hypothetical protein FACS189447_03140 [Spirochaetia bacterium]|nr:hypothetical protein FACS189447_03140 [Spirochaetia bacterium]
MKIKEGNRFINKKDSRIYVFIGLAFRVINAQDGQILYLYKDEETGILYSQEAAEFEKKFKEYKEESKNGKV